MLRRPRRGLPIALALLATPACSFFVDTGDLAKAGGDAGDAPAGADADVEASQGFDAAADGEGAADGDAGTSDAGGGDLDAAPDAPFCVAHDGGATLLCDDFDDPNRVSLLQGGWAQVYSYRVGEVGTAPVFSPPHAASFVYALDGGADRVASNRVLPFPTARNELVVQARIFAKAETGGSTLSVVIGTSPSCEINYFGFNSPGRIIARCPDYVDVGMAPAILYEQWNLVRLHARRTASGVNLKIEVGETPAPLVATGDVAVDGGVLGAQGANAVTIELGESGDPVSGAVYYDDVLAEGL